MRPYWNADSGRKRAVQEMLQFRPPGGSSSAALQAAALLRALQATALLPALLLALLQSAVLVVVRELLRATIPVVLWELCLGGLHLLT